MSKTSEVSTFFAIGNIWKKAYNVLSKKTKEEEMESKYYNEDKLLILKLTEEIDECTVQKIRRKADYEIEKYMPRKVIFDFNSVTFMDSAGIGLIIGRYRIANMLGGTIEIANVTDSIKRVLELSGLCKIIKITELEEIAG